MNASVCLSIDNHIATVVMCDRERKNTFTSHFVSELIDVFSRIEQHPTIKVVVLHGYDNYFCCGGTKEELLQIYEGRRVFTDLNIHDILLNCKFPVISAMQGHALGGGFILGCYADIVVMAKQCIYSTNFMKYGFTPGFGSTYIIPRLFGDSLGREMLFSAKSYHGLELQQRGSNTKIVDKEDVLSVAFQLAQEFIDKPRISLLALKRSFTESVKRQLPAYIKEELAMHELTFTESEEVRSRIEHFFGR
ncbi:MAG: putative polyketide biosynthesis enoyl-CoA isomerase PksI [marine bacterium B5-7]|nr:MAG: putative polyketide biosynthesis enoyl-CoA isomerase PksI [marine bacterium B5-7]